jgi:hypothetical protein
MRPDAVGLGGFDSHTLPPHRHTDFESPRVVMSSRRLIDHAMAATLIAAALLVLQTKPAWSQQTDSARAAAVRRPAAPAAQDTARPPISPKRAFLYSLLAPGYGQSVLDRPIAGGMFFAAEVTWIALATKSAFDLRFARAHQRDSLIATYKTNPDGTVQRDSLGNAVGATYVPNRYATDRVAARRKHLEDYYALIIANHLLAGAEAFVSAQLWDLPGHVSIKQMPFGHALVASFRW